VDPSVTYAYVTLEPIGVPRDYTRDFTISMDIAVLRRVDSLPITSKHIVLPIEFKKQRQMIGSWP